MEPADPIVDTYGHNLGEKRNHLNHCAPGDVGEDFADFQPKDSAFLPQAAG